MPSRRHSDRPTPPLHSNTVNGPLRATFPQVVLRGLRDALFFVSRPFSFLCQYIVHASTLSDYRLLDGGWAGLERNSHVPLCHYFQLIIARARACEQSL